MNYPRKLMAGELCYEIDYARSDRMTSSVKIRDGRVIVRLSRYAMGSKRDELVGKFLRWAEKRLLKVNKGIFAKPIYEDGGRIITHNKIYELNVKIIPQDNSRAALKNGYILDIRIADIFRKLNPAGIKKKVQFLAEKLIIKDQTAYLFDVLKELNQLYFQEEIKSCCFKRVNSRFGSCSTKRNINIAFRLLFAPREVFRYVCVHELAHLKEMNHSKRFWHWVGQAMSDYKGAERWLRDNGFMLG